MKIEDMKFRENVEVVCSDGFWYELEQEYILPRYLSYDKETINEIQHAIDVLKECQNHVELA